MFYDKIEFVYNYKIFIMEIIIFNSLIIRYYYNIIIKWITKFILPINYN